MSRHDRCDNIIIYYSYNNCPWLAWGYTYGPPMAVAPINQVRRVVEYAVTEIPSGKIDLGIPNYGYDWPLPFVQGQSKAQSISNQYAVELARRYGVSPEHLYCIGDQNNDLPLLRVARQAFAPANAIEELKQNPAVTVVGHCLDGAVADVIEWLKERYPAKEPALT